MRFFVQRFGVIFLLVLVISTFFVYKKWAQISLWIALQSSSSPWAREQICSDFSPFLENGITQEALDETFKKIAEQNIPAYRYRVIGGDIFRKPKRDDTGRAFIYDKMLKRIQRSKQLPLVDFILCVMDGVPEVYVPPRFWVTEKQAPLLCWAKKKDAPALVLVPDFLTTRESGWHQEVAAVNEQYRSISWEKRKDKAFWRGSASDKIYTAENYFEKPRFRISLLSTQRADLVDAGFCKAPEEICPRLLDLKLILGHTSVADHLQYKYLPVLDGWMCTFPGFQWRLLSGSLSFKQESDEVQYFYSALQPFVHYIPIKGDMSDLLEKIIWAKEQDCKAHAIAENARSFALENLMPNQIYSYLYWVLIEYSSLQRFNCLEVDSGWYKI